MMKAHVRVGDHTEYVIDNVTSVTYRNNMLYIVYSDDDGTLVSMSFSKASLDDGSVVIS